VDPVLASLRAIHFQVQGFDRTYEDFFVGFGFFVSAFLLFVAVLAWQLGGMSKEALASMPAVRWGLPICFVALTVLSRKYFFLIPLMFSALIAFCFMLAARLSVSAPGR